MGLPADLVEDRARRLERAILIKDDGQAWLVKGDVLDCCVMREGKPAVECSPVGPFPHNEVLPACT